MDPILAKQIQVEQTFANAVYRSFTQIRYGITPCCFFDLDDAWINYELCRWQQIQPVDPNCEIVCT
jgi:hypothetical protein